MISWDINFILFFNIKLNWIKFVDFSLKTFIICSHDFIFLRFFCTFFVRKYCTYAFQSWNNKNFYERSKNKKVKKEIFNYFQVQVNFFFEFFECFFYFYFSSRFWWYFFIFWWKLQFFSYFSTSQMIFFFIFYALQENCNKFKNESFFSYKSSSFTAWQTVSNLVFQESKEIVLWEKSKISKKKKQIGHNNTEKVSISFM